MGERGSNKILYALIAVGALMVVAGLAMNALPNVWSSFARAIEEGAAKRPAEDESPEWLGEPGDEPADVQAALQALIDEQGAQEPPDEQRVLVWHADVITAEGHSRGDPCVLVVVAGRPGAPARRVSLECDGRSVFDAEVSTSQLDAIALHPTLLAHRADVRATALGAEGVTVLHALTRERTIVVRSPSSIARFFVDDLSVASEGSDPSAAVTNTQYNLRRLAIPVATEGAAPAAIARAAATGRVPARGAPTCELFGHATMGRSCRLLLRCDGEVIYGAARSGYNDCGVSMGRIASARDSGFSPQDSDPMVDLDVAAGALTVSDATAEGEWSVRFELLVDPRCTLPASLAGAALDEEDGRFAWSFQSSDLGAGAITWNGEGIEEGIENVSLTLDCGSGELAMRTESVDDSRLVQAVYGLTFGPGFRGVVGNWWASSATDADGGVPGALWSHTPRP